MDSLFDTVDKTYIPLPERLRPKTLDDFYGQEKIVGKNSPVRKMIENDLVRFESNIRNIALYDYNLIGVEGQTSSSENGENRSYVDRNKLFSGVIPLSR